MWTNIMQMEQKDINTKINYVHKQMRLDNYGKEEKDN